LVQLEYGATEAIENALDDFNPTLVQLEFTPALKEFEVLHIYFNPTLVQLESIILTILCFVLRNFNPTLVQLECV